jgi:hypothetical protein
MPKERILSAAFITLLIILIVGGVSIIRYVKKDAFSAERIIIDTAKHAKVKKQIDSLCEKNGVFLLQSEKNNEIYLILDGSHTSLEGEAPYFSNVKVTTEKDSIMIYFNEEPKNYTVGKYPEQRLVYKINTDKDYEFIKLFKNGEETHFDSIGA